MSSESDNTDVQVVITKTVLFSSKYNNEKEFGRKVER